MIVREIESSTWLFSCWLLVLLLVPASSWTSEVKTPHGLIEGKVENGVRVFKGIPYAQAPIGDLRWRAPQNMKAWEGRLLAKEFGPACPQIERRMRPLPVPMNEDCLTLNIWAPQNQNDIKKLPVMVWIHGGAFILGTAAHDFYDGTAFAKNDVVLVTLNYRIGRLGFFAHPALKQERDQHYPEALLGNYGLMDQLQALRWVQENIASFGGDPKNVTVFGESAGGVSVNYLMGMPAAKGLFHKAISESGGGFQQALYLEKRRNKNPSLMEKGQQWAQKLGVEDDVNRLRNIPVEKFNDRSDFFSVGTNGPVIDGELVVDDIAARFFEGNIHSIPYLAGANSFEASLMRTTGVNNERIFVTVGEDLSKITAIYAKAGVKGEDALAQQLYGDAAFVAPARFLVENATKHGQKAWRYHFDYVLTAQRRRTDGASHGSEIPFIFNTLHTQRGGKIRARKNDKVIADTLIQYWVNFAKYGDPNGIDNTHLPQWKPYTKNNQEALMVDKKEVRTVNRLFKERLDFHAERYAKQTSIGN